MGAAAAAAGSFLAVLRPLAQLVVSAGERLSGSPPAKVAKTADTLKDEDVEMVEAHCVLCRVVGLLVGMASYHGILIDLPLPASVTKLMDKCSEATDQQEKVEKIAPELADLYAVDASLAKSLKYLLDFEDGSIRECLGVTFTASSNPLLASAAQGRETEREGGVGDLEEITAPRYVELKPGGAEIYVERGNRAEFVQKFVRYALYESSSAMVNSYVAGARTLFCGDMIDICSCEEIELLLCGTREVGDLSELRLRTVYQGEFFDEHRVIHWFWEILSDMQNFEKRAFLRFLTGSDRVPVGGLSTLGLVIASTGQSSNALASSHTCFNMLHLPASYESKLQMKEKLHISIQHCEGFGFA